MNTFRVKIDGKEYTSVFPLKYGQYLDEQLDYAIFEIIRTKEQYFTPTTPVEITITSEVDGVKEVNTLRYVVSSDNSRESPLGSGEYRHQITAIEPTKLLEGIPVETLCFTQAGGRFNFVQGVADFTVEEQTSGISNNPNVPTPQIIDTEFILPSLRSIVTTQFGLLQPPTGVSGDTITRYIREGWIRVIQANETTEIPFDEEGNIVGDGKIKIKGGVNTFRYYFHAEYVNTNSASIIPTIIQEYYDATFSIFGSPPAKKPLMPWTIESVINRVLELERPLIFDNTTKDYVTPKRFKLQLPTDKDKLALFKKIAPEFTFTRQSLREVLKTIGGYIHAEPRLIYNEETELFDTIVFDFYGEQEYATCRNSKGETIRFSEAPYEGATASYAIEQACTALDSYIDNFVNRLNSNSSVVGQPFEGGAQSFRTETSGLQYTEQSMFFPTYSPISKIHKFMVYYKEKGYDITDFVYEESIYNTQLSSYESAYPVSKMYGLYYKQDQKGIYGFFFERTNAFDQALEKYAIENILKAVGCTFTTGTNAMEAFMSLSFELVYTPIYSARIAHSKSYVGDWLTYPRVLNYAQSAPQVETEYYGENIKGAVERLGTIEKAFTYTTKRFGAIPKAGQLFDDNYYISTVAVEVKNEKFKFTLGLSKHFNRISSYVGVSSYKRIYEVSEVMVQARDTLYKDYLVLTDYSDDYAYPLKVDCLIGNTALTQISETFYQRDSSYGRIDAITVETKTKQFASIASITLPVIASAEGNVMSFTWQYEDNFSAGQRAVPIGESYYGQDVQYSDYYGRIYYESFFLRHARGETFLNIANIFPYLDRLSNSPISISVNNNYGLVRRKDSREALRTTYAIELVTDDESYVIGSSFPALCPLVSDRRTRVVNGATVPVKTKLVLLNKRINKFSREIAENSIIAEVDISNQISVGSYNADGLDCPYIKGLFQNLAVNGTALAWAIVTESYTGETKEYEDEDGNPIAITENQGHYLLFGKNTSVENGGTVSFMICPTHDVYEYLKYRKGE